MKVFGFSGKLSYNYGVKVELKGYFVQDDGEEIKGYLEEKQKNKTTASAIKGLYNESSSQMLFIKTSNPGGYTPELYIFEDSFTDGWVSSYNRYSSTFFVYAGVRNAVAELNVFEEIFESEGEIMDAYAQFIQKMYWQCYVDSTTLSKNLVEDILKYKWLFSFVKHLKGSAL